ncbi:MAG: NAD(P)-dependent oxidoreductase [Prevotellaceae bacterium]|jgi:nucleoside-diphosphate-sugar epimerase|nr:NAD(P)-dependent oxidoreductase [Prevotellaceae bacterium]
MIVSIIGTNGFLADTIGRFCAEQCHYSIRCYGLSEPIHHYDLFAQVNLMTQYLNYDELVESDLIVYASGAGIQSNLGEKYDLVYALNVNIPIIISKELSKRSYKGTFVTFGSCFEIGANNQNIQFDESQLSISTLPAPNDYCISKRLLTRFAMSDVPTFNYLHLILPTIYGAGESKHRLIPYTINTLKEEKVPQFTNGEQVRQYLHINDVVKILFSLYEKKEQGIFNISGVETLSVKQIVAIIFSFFGKELPNNIFGKEQRIDVSMQNLQLNGSKLFSILPNFKYSLFSEVIKEYL